MTATATWFEIGAHYMHDGRFRRIEVDTTNAGQQIFSVVRRSGIDRTAPKYPADPSQTPIQGGFNPADVIYGTTSESSSEIGSVSLNQAEINRLSLVMSWIMSVRIWVFMKTLSMVKWSMSKSNPAV